MPNTYDAIALLSLGSSTLENGNITALYKCAEQHDCRSIMFCVLDSLEMINLQVLHGHDARTAALRVQERVIRAQALLHYANTLLIQITLAQSVERQSLVWEQLYGWLTALYHNNAEFRHLCQNQVFKNLDPLLRSKGVKNRRHASVDLLADYLIREIAVRVSMTEAHDPRIELAFARDDGITQRVCSGEFGGTPMLITKRPPKYIVVEAQRRGYGLSARNLNFRFLDGPAQRGGRLFEIRDFSFDAPAGAITGILGPSGCGKTTLLKLLGGHLRLRSGSIYLEKRQLTQTRVGRRSTATLYQNHMLFPHMTVAQNVAFGIKRRNQALNDDSVEDLTEIYIKRFGLLNQRSSYPEGISGGERQRTALARALITEPQLLLLDEPTASLDHERRTALANDLRLIATLPPSPVIVIVSHDRDFLFSIATHLAVMDSGKILQQGPITEVLNRPASRLVSTILGTHGWLYLKEIADGHARLTHSAQELGRLPASMISTLGQGQSGVVLVPIDAVRISPTERDNVCLVTASVQAINVYGSRTRLSLTIGSRTSRDGMVFCDVRGHRTWAEWPRGDKYEVSIDLQRCVAISEPSDVCPEERRAQHV